MGTQSTALWIRVQAQGELALLLRVSQGYNQGVFWDCVLIWRLDWEESTSKCTQVVGKIYFFVVTGPMTATSY